MTKPILAILFAGTFLLLAAPRANAAVSENCYVDVNQVTATVVCTGLLYESAYLTWCPNHPAIACRNPDIIECWIGTTLPWMCWLL